MTPEQPTETQALRERLNQLAMQYEATAAQAGTYVLTCGHWEPCTVVGWARNAWRHALDAESLRQAAAALLAAEQQTTALREALTHLRRVQQASDMEEGAAWEKCHVCGAEVGWPVETLPDWPALPICDSCVIDAALSAHPDPTTAKETPPMKQCLWCERDLTPPPTDRPYLTSAGKSICYRCVEQLAALRNPELPPAPASAQGAAQAAEEKVYHAYEAARRLLSKHLADRVDFDVVIAGLSAARRFIFDSYTSPSTQGPPEGTRTAEPVVPASKLRALSEQWEQESDRVNLRHSSPRSAMRRCAADLDHLLDGETQKTQDQKTATRVDGPSSSDRFGTAGTDGKGSERS